MPDEFRNKKVLLLGGTFSPNGQKGKTNFFQKKIFWPKFFKFFLAHLIGNFFPIPKWSDFLIIAQNWPIYGGFSFTLLKTGYFPISRWGSPEAPLGVKICPKMVPTILTGHITMVYDEKWAQNFFERGWVEINMKFWYCWKPLCGRMNYTLMCSYSINWTHKTTIG